MTRDGDGATHRWGLFTCVWAEDGYCSDEYLFKRGQQRPSHLGLYGTNESFWPVVGLWRIEAKNKSQYAEKCLFRHN